jgi:CHAT domain-containing protein/tetratricopeptide (TPR) repeat protein
VTFPAFAAPQAAVDPLEAARGLIKQGKYADAETQARELLDEMRSEHGSESPEAAEAMDVLVESLWRGGKAQQPETRELAEQVIERKESAMGPDHVSVAESLANLGVICFFLGDFDVARSSWERALAIRERALGPEDPAVAQILNNLANLATNLGDLALAREMNERALAIREKAFGTEHPLVAQSLTNLAIALTESGEYAAALPVLERSLALNQKLIGAGHPKTALSEVALGRAYMETGDYERAIELFDRAMETFEKTIGPDHPQVALLLNNQAEALRELGEYAAARPLYERALAINEKALGPEHPLVAGSLGNLGYLEEEAGNLQTAIALHERAVRIREAALGDDDPQLALSLNNLASACAKIGDYERALPLYERALEIRRMSLGSDHPLVAETLIGLALLRARTGERAAALDLALDAEAISRDHLRLTGRSLSEELALRYSAVRWSGLDLALTLAADGLGDEDRARVLDAVVRSRAVVLDGIADRRRTALEIDDPQIARLVAELAAARTKLANLTVRGPGKLDASTYREVLADARDEKERTERKLAVASAEFAREQERSRLGLDDVTDALPEDGALLAWALYERYELTPATQDDRTTKKSTPSPSYMAFVVSSGQAPAAVDVGLAETLENLVAWWREEVSTGLLTAGRDGRQAETAYRAVGGRLRERVWDPLTPHLEDVRRLFVVPDGALNLVSLASLPTGSAGYLIEGGPVLHYVSAERDLVSPESPTRRGNGLLVLGGPDYDAKVGQPDSEGGSYATTRGATSPCSDFDRLDFGALAATDREASEIVALWKAAGHGGESPDELSHLSGSAATEAAFKAEAPGRRVLHLATHGFFLGGNCAAAAGTRGIGSVANTETPEATAREVRPTTSPLLLSGLALAGANQRRAAATDEEDGILTAEEIAALDLSSVEWAVLSACDTALGEIRAGEGVFGLRRAMRIAGVRSLIMSLWSVDDEATLQWMAALYRGRLEQGLDTAASTREAGLSVLEARRDADLDTHPFYWAAFVAAGQWQ